MEGTIEFLFIGWVHSEGHDKVWTSLKVGKNYYCAWGRRGKSLAFKKHGSVYNLNALEAQKRRKGYEPVEEFMLFTAFPDFQEQVEQQLMMATLSDNIR